MTSLQDFQERVDKWISEIGGGYWSPLAMLAALVEEVGEVARIINYIEGEKKRKEGEEIEELSVELGDVIFATICIANYFNINLEDAINKTIAKYEKRDFKRFKD